MNSTPDYPNHLGSPRRPFSLSPRRAGALPSLVPSYSGLLLSQIAAMSQTISILVETVVGIELALHVEKLKTTAPSTLVGKVDVNADRTLGQGDESVKNLMSTA